jgi:hypothetical protein
MLNVSLIGYNYKGYYGALTDLMVDLAIFSVTEDIDDLFANIICSYRIYMGSNPIPLYANKLFMGDQDLSIHYYSTILKKFLVRGSKLTVNCESTLIPQLKDQEVVNILKYPVGDFKVIQGENTLLPNEFRVKSEGWLFEEIPNEYHYFV